MLNDLPEEPSLLPSTHVGQLITIYNSSTRDLMYSSGLLGVRTCVNTHTHRGSLKIHFSGLEVQLSNKALAKHSPDPGSQHYPKK